MFFLFILTSLAHALDGNDKLTLTLAGGDEITGWFVRAVDDEVVISASNRWIDVPLVLVEQVTRNGEPMGREAFHAEIAVEVAKHKAFLADPPPHPAPATVIGLSLFWAGAGHAALGDWKSLAAYSILEGTLLGVSATQLLVFKTDQGVLPLLALDLFFRGYAASESAREAQRRRRLMGRE